MELITGQLHYVIASFLCGVFLMFFYDFVLVFRQLKKHGKISLFIEDWLFWSMAAIFVFQMIFALNNGVLRNFFVIAFLLGMLLYRKTVKERLQRAILSMIHFIIRPYVWILKKIQKNRKKSLK